MACVAAHTHSSANAPPFHSTAATSSPTLRDDTSGPAFHPDASMRSIRRVPGCTDTLHARVSPSSETTPETSEPGINGSVGFSCTSHMGFCPQLTNAVHCWQACFASYIWRWQSEMLVGTRDRATYLIAALDLEHVCEVQRRSNDADADVA